MCHVDSYSFLLENSVVLFQPCMFLRVCPVEGVVCSQTSRPQASPAGWIFGKIPGGRGERDASLGRTAHGRVQEAVMLGISRGDSRYSWETHPQGPRNSF